MRTRLTLILISIIVSLQACVYRMDIPQGNVVEAAKLEQLKTGMTRQQVEYLLGKAAINDLYHANQAHYVYYKYDGETRQVVDRKQMVLTYENGVLVSIDGAL